MSKEAQVQMNGGKWTLGYTWTGQCTSCGQSFGAYSRKAVQDLGYDHYRDASTKNNPHRWAFGRMG